MRIAVFDLGSTTFCAMVVDIDGNGRMERVLKDRRTLHLAAAAALNGHVPADAASLSLRAARLMRKRVERTEPDLVIASATSALRDAANGDHLIELLELAIKAPIRVLDGAEEAELAYWGATAGLAITHEPVLVADLGGGSLDIAVGDGVGVTTAATFALGASRMTALHIRSNPPHRAELDAIANAVAESCAAVFESMRLREPMRCIVTGGTGRALARMLVDGEVNGLAVPTAELHTLTRKLCSLPKGERARIEGIQAKRVDVLPAGSLILSCLADGLDVGAITISEWGLREGLLREAVGIQPVAATLAS